MNDRRRPHHSRETDETWFQSHWRPMMSWSYGIVCLWDFMLAPIFFAWFSWVTKTPMTPWVPLTTQGGGLYHLAMGAIVGVTSYGKSQERITSTNVSGGFQQPPQFQQFQQPDPNAQQQQQPIVNPAPVVVNPPAPITPPATHTVNPSTNPEPEL